jgi:hypothetical protein
MEEKVRFAISGPVVCEVMRKVYLTVWVYMR